MEREFGKELVRAFGTRMKRVYDLEEGKLPASISDRLAELRRVEKAHSSASDSDERGHPEHGFVD